jgi:hypothetical protein
MADFGWAFVKGGLVSGSTPPSGAVQFNNGSNKFGGSADLIFTSGSTSTLEMTGNILVNGEVSASTFYGDGSNLSGITTSPAGATTQIQYNNAGAFAGSSNLTFDGTTLNITGNLNVSGTFAANELIVNVENRNVINISATGSTQFGDSTDDTHIFTGSMEISAASNPLKLYGVQAGTPPNNSSYLALDSSYNLVLTSAAGQAGISYSRTAITTTTTASVASTILGVSGTAAIDIRLPSAADYDAGQYFTVKDESGAADLKNITILASGSQKIDGQSTVVLQSPYAAINIYSDGVSKFFIY